MNLVIRTCKYCNQTFLIEHGSFANHVRYCKKNNSYNHKKCLNKLKNKAEERYGKIKTFTVICFRCGTLFQVSEKEKLFPQKEKYFCNKSCSNSGRETSWSEKSKKDLSKKMSPIIKKLWQNKEYSKKVLQNNFYFTSKGEREVRDYFMINFPDDNWTFGGIITFDDIKIVRDLYSNKLKICIEYDGIWHFDNIKDQLLYKHKQDIALEKWCIQNKYRLIRIDEDLYYKDKEYYMKQLYEEVYNSSNQITKFYSDSNIKLLNKNLDVIRENV